MKKHSAKHPYHYSEDKNIIQFLLDYAIPTAILFFFFKFYTNSSMEPRSLIKITGLAAITLLGLTLIVGPLSKLFKGLSLLKAHRKAWGIISFLFALSHTALVYIYLFKFNLTRFIDTSNPRYPNILTGLLGLIILALVTLTSNKKALSVLDPKVWKSIQTLSYVAMGLALSHFFLVSQNKGVFELKSIYTQITFAFSALVIALRIGVMFIPDKK